MADYESARHNMVESQLRTSGVTEIRILDVFAEIPRENFVPAAMKPVAYLDADIRLTAGGEEPHFLMRPYAFGKLLELAEVGAGDVVLDIGAGTGYSAAVLSKLGDTVVALEASEELASKANETLTSLGITNVAVVTGPHEEGYQKEAPYDVIVVEGSVEHVPQGLLDQLRDDGGRLLTVFNKDGRSRGRIYTRRDGIVTHRDVFDGAVPLLQGFAVEEGFVF